MPQNQIDDKTMDKPKISLEDAYRVYEIFNKNKWFNKTGHESVHRYLMAMLVNFNDEEKELLFQLCEKYLWIPQEEYIGLLLDILNKIEDQKLLTCKRIVVFPIVKPADIGKVKSSNSLLYSFKSTHLFNNRYENVTFKIIDSYFKFEKEQFKADDLLFLVDDYIGSGDTLKDTVDEILKNKTLKKIN